MKIGRIITFIFTLCVTNALYALSPGAQAQVAVCAACHGVAGVSTQPIWPNLAGQHAKYLAEQLRAYKQGTRTDPIMSSITAPLTDDLIEELAKFYANMPQTSASLPIDAFAKGENIYFHGDADKHITACVACHGPKGLGNEPAGFPILNGQQSAYIIQQLKAFKSKQRHNDRLAIMQTISQQMSDADMEAVALYLKH